jgi:hypothetical protein
MMRVPQARVSCCPFLIKFPCGHEVSLLLKLTISNLLWQVSYPFHDAEDEVVKARCLIPWIGKSHGSPAKMSDPMDWQVLHGLPLYSRVNYCNSLEAFSLDACLRSCGLYSLLGSTAVSLQNEKPDVLSESTCHVGNLTCSVKAHVTRTCHMSQEHVTCHLRLGYPSSATMDSTHEWKDEERNGAKHNWLVLFACYDSFCLAY